MHFSHSRLPLWGLVTGCTLGLTLTAPSGVRADSLQVVMSGLNNPYGLTFGPDGGLYVADAGTGGSGPSFVNGAGDTVSFGDTGDITRLLGGVQTQVMTGLPSVASATSATGITGITFDSSGNLFGVFGLGGVTSNRDGLVSALPSGSNAIDLGQLVGLNTSTNTITALSDLATYVTNNYATDNPDGTAAETNPYGIAALTGGGFAVTDGGGNLALKVAAGGGAPTLLTTFPALPSPLFPGFGPPTYQSVPTGIVQSPGGSLYVGEFTGFPFPAGAADVFRVDPTTGTSSILASGFSSITGLAYGSNGDLYVLDQTTTTYAGAPSDAQLFEVDPTTGTKTLLTDLASGPTYSGLAFGNDALYISSQGITPGSGQVLRYSLAVPEPSSYALLGLGLVPLALRARKRRRAS